MTPPFRIGSIRPPLIADASVHRGRKSGILAQSRDRAGALGRRVASVHRHDRQAVKRPNTIAKWFGNTERQENADVGRQFAANLLSK